MALLRLIVNRYCFRILSHLLGFFCNQTEVKKTKQTSKKKKRCRVAYGYGGLFTSMNYRISVSVSPYVILLHHISSIYPTYQKICLSSTVARNRIKKIVN